MRLCGCAGGCASSTRPGEARAAAIHSRTSTRPSGSCVRPGLGATCRGRRREVLSESRMQGNPHVRFDERDVETELWSSHLGTARRKGRKQTCPAYRHRATSPLYPTSTCMMGTHERAVVDSALRVHGIEGLRVVDASIMPAVVSGNTNAATIMIAEKGAEMILDEERAGSAAKAA